MTRTKTGRFKQGHSGNPSGRPSSSAAKLREIRDTVADELPELIRTILTAAKAGDMAACKILLDRCIPPAKPCHPAISIETPDISNPLERADCIEREMLAGRLSPDAAAAAIGVLIANRQLVESIELEARIARLEATNGATDAD